MADPVTSYAQKVAARKIPAGELQRLACERHLRDMDTRKDRGLVWKPAAVEQAITFAAHCQHYKGEWAGTPLKLEPWQVFIVGSLEGWTRESDGLRRYTKAFVELPRGNGKSVLAGVIALKRTFFDGEPGADGFCFATKRDQATIVFQNARQMVLKSAALRKHVQALLYSLTSDATTSRLVPLGRDADTLDGLRPHVAIGDEIHKHATPDLIEVIETGMTTRRQPLLFLITTAGLGRVNVWWETRAYSVKLLEGVAENDSWFTLIACADPDDDWHNPATWKKANPNYGVSIKPRVFEDDYRKAAGMPSYENTFRRLYLGQLVEQENRYIPMDQWDAPAASAVIDPVALRGRECFAGLDLSTTTDLSALVLVFPDTDGGYTVLPHFWCPEDRIQERAKRDRVPYDDWVRRECLTATPGNVTDYAHIYQAIQDLTSEYRIREIGFDRWNASYLVTQLKDSGAPMVEIGQGYASMHAPTMELARQLAAGTLRHGAHPVLRWNAGNLVVATDPAGNVKPDKAKATERIDGVVALIMGLKLATARQEAPVPMVSLL